MRLLLALSLTLVAGCATMAPLPNGCLVDAIEFQYAQSARNQLEGKTAFNEILIVEFVDQKAAHALSIFEHKGELWAYDYAMGSRRVGATSAVDQPSTVARLIYAPWRVKGATWL